MTELGRDARSLVDSMREADGPSDADRERVRLKLEARLGIGLAAASAAALASKTAVAKTGAASVFGAGVLTKAGILIAVLGVLAGGAALLRPAEERVVLADPALRGLDAMVVAAAPAAPVPEATPPPPEPAAIAALEEPPPQARPAPRRQRAALPRSTAAPVASAPPPASRIALNDELMLLTRAQAALASGQAEQALDLLDEHALAYRDGALREERIAVRVFALCAAGREDEARAVAQRFALEAPRSPLAARVRAACAAGPGADPKR